MIVYHQTAKEFAKFDLSKARPGAFGVGVYFYVDKPAEAGVRGVVCDVQLFNPMKDGKKIVADEKWNATCRAVERLVLRESGCNIRIPRLGCSDIRNFRILCDVYAGNVENPNWIGFLSEFRRVTGCDGFVARDFVVCFDVNKIAVVGRF